MLLDAVLEDVLRYSCVHGTQRIIQQVDVCIMVNGSGQTDAGLDTRNGKLIVETYGGYPRFPIVILIDTLPSVLR